MAACSEARNYEGACHHRSALRWLSSRTMGPRERLGMSVYSRCRIMCRLCYFFIRFKSLSDLVMGRRRGIDMLSWYK